MQNVPSCAASGPATAVAPSLIWESSETSSIHVAYSVIERLERDVIAAFNALPKRGVEVGGLLLGRVDESGNRTVYVDDFAPVACEYRHGPSYLRSDVDRPGLESAIAKAGTTVVGFYRSHTRKDFASDEEDVSRFQTYFPNSTQVFLLIKPLSMSQSIASLSLWEDGEIRGDSGHPEFPFGRRWIPEHLEQSPAKTLTIEAAPNEAFVPPEPVSPQRQRTWIPLAACLTAAVTGLVGFQAWEAGRPPRVIQQPPASVREVKPSAMLPLVPPPSSATVSRSVVTPASPPAPPPKVHRSRLHRSSDKTRKKGLKHRLARLWPHRRSHLQ